MVSIDEEAPIWYLLPVCLLQLDVESPVLQDRFISLDQDLRYLFGRSLVHCCAPFDDSAILRSKFLLQSAEFSSKLPDDS